MKNTVAFCGIFMCKEGKCQEKSLLAVFDDFLKFRHEKKSVFWNNFRTTFSNLKYDSSKFKLEHPLYDKKKRMNKKYESWSSQYLDKPLYFFGAPGMLESFICES